jgi:hypothetical protein
MTDPRKITVTLSVDDYSNLIGILRIVGPEQRAIADKHLADSEPRMARALFERADRMKALADTLQSESAAAVREKMPAVSGFGHMGFVGVAA